MTHLVQYHRLQHKIVHVEGSCVYAADVAGTPNAATADTDGTTAGQQGDLAPPGSDPLAV